MLCVLWQYRKVLIRARSVVLLSPVILFVFCAIGTTPVARAQRTVVWIAAHPDDEIFGAPLLGELCVERGYRCSFAVFTAGERGVCRDGSACSHLAAAREREMQRSAASIGAGVLQWRYPDGSALDPRDVIRNWSGRGGCTALISQLEDVMRSADVVLTFDPAHGTSEHPDHRAVGELVETAVARMSRPPALYTIENRVEVERGGSDIRWLDSPQAPPGSLVSAPRSWSYAVNVARRYRTQFDAEAVRRISDTPRSARTVVAARVTPTDRVVCNR